MKRIEFRRHALDRMAEYDIAPATVERAVRQPLWTEPDPYRPGIRRHFTTAPERGGEIVRVALVEEADHIRVMSAHPDRGAKPPHDHPDAL